MHRFQQGRPDSGETEAVPQASRLPRCTRFFCPHTLQCKALSLVLALGWVSCAKGNEAPKKVHATIQGKIIDESGNPVAGARINAIFHSPHIVFQQYLENHEAPSWSTTSDKSGNYELIGLDTANPYHLAGFLVAKKSCRSFVKIYVKADGLEQKSVPQVPLITEEVLKRAQSMLHEFMKISETAHLKEYKPRPVPPGEVSNLWKIFDPAHTTEIPVPTSTGNTITGMDFVLRKTNPGATHEKASH